MKRMKQYIKTMREITSSNINNNIGLTTAFKELDFKMSGFKKQELCAIASKSGYGKTALVLSSVIENIQNDNGVLYFSLDLQEKQLLTRIIAMESKIRLPELKRGMLTDNQEELVNSTIDKYTNTKLFIDDTKYPTLKYIKNKIKSKAKNKKNNLQMIVIDNIDLIDNSHNINIAKALKKLAIKFNLPIVVLTPLSNKIENRLDQQPRLSDIKNKSLKIEADLILFIYINDYAQKQIEYNKELKSKLKGENPSYKSTYKDKNIVSSDIIIAKQKHGSRDIKVELELTTDIALFNIPQMIDIPYSNEESPRVSKIFDNIINFKDGYTYKDGLSFKTDDYVNIEILDAYKLKLSKIPNEIYNLKNLKILRIQQNNISSLPKKLLELKSLESLCLCDNNLIKVPKFLIKFKDLSELGICNNKNLKKLPDNFKELKLTSLSIDGKLLNKYIDMICQIKSIEELDIHGGKISKEVFKKLTSLPNLKDLTLKSIKNKRFPKNIPPFKELEFLTIKKSQYFLQYDNNITEDIFSDNIKSIEINTKEKIDV